MKFLFSLAFLIQCLLGHGASGADKHEVSVMEGDSVTLHTGVQTKEQEKIAWYDNDIRIAQINGDQSKICTDVQCNVDNERFRDRLKLDHQTGSLTIMNTKHTDAGVYELRIIRGNSKKTIFTVAVHGVFSVGPDGTSVFVMKGDSVTLNTGVQTNQQEKIIWYFNDMRIAQITGDQIKICTDDHCEESFRDRLKLDPQTGSLTITNTTNTDSGEYKLQSSSSKKRYSITVRDVSAAEQDEMKRKSVKEGESVTFDTRVIKQPNVSMTWYFNDIFIAEITGDQSKICRDEHCEEKFRNRLKLDHQTGSLTVMNTTDSGEYKVEINGGSISIMKTFSSLVSATDSGPSSAAAVIAAVVVVVVLLVAAAAGLIYHRRQPGPPTADTPLSPATNRTGPPTADTQSLPATNGTGSPTADMPLLPATNRTGPPTADTQSLPATNRTGPPTADTQSLPATNRTGPPTADTQSLPATNRTGPPTADTQSLPATKGTGSPTADRPLLPATNEMGPPPADTHIDANETKL